VRWSPGRENSTPRAVLPSLRGVLDAIDSLPAFAQKMVLALAAGWPQRDVRVAARELTSPVTIFAPTAPHNGLLVSVGSPQAACDEPTLF
jgi:hypothetical protein